jgi:gluconate 2-dehydrogenase gamma chain
MNEDVRISRRDLLKVAGAAGAAALSPSALSAVPAVVATPAPAVALPVVTSAPLLNLTAAETEILAAIVDRLIPTDELGAGALDAGALRFIDRALSEAESSSADAYRATHTASSVRTRSW